MGCRHQKIHAEDCRECEAGDGKIDRIEREIRLVGPLSREQQDIVKAAKEFAVGEFTDRAQEFDREEKFPEDVTGVISAHGAL